MAATHRGDAVLNGYRATAPRHLRRLGAVPGVRAAALRQSTTEVGVEGLAVVATSTTAAKKVAGLSFKGLDGVAATALGLLLRAQHGLAFAVDCSQAKEFALSHWPFGGVDGERLFGRRFDAAMNVREDVAGDVLASLNQRMTVRLCCRGSTRTDCRISPPLRVGMRWWAPSSPPR